ncbi:TetR/AcrR family transcriptional regulator [Streptosporangium sp. NBC_01756]|uniref:TetR/AcrR family transcriptional regulator n=1 Tax=Streptosporangium sp. NBC_01756 TaxID=2975950 RepID=UPI002DD7FFE4|nr:TetR/AcrR family transcriptional regulator [Streptosporangium sp. NBC_01756]WSC84161.1 TetR/AcrR family transcriptional regulator [Streptosporangium sp. NBC_01756]
MSSATPHRPRAGRPPRISRREILDAALRIIERDGMESLTMRRLAKDVGSTPMALYHHVQDKEELLLLLLDDYAGQLPRPVLPEEPRERLVAAAQAMHDSLAGCPWIVEVLTADDLLSASALWFPENIVDSAVKCGLTPEQGVHAYRAIWYYTAGEIIIRAAAARRRDADRPTYRDQVFADLDPQALPRLASLGGRWNALTAEDTYRQGLIALVNGLLGP